MDIYDYLREKAYFARLLFWDEDVDLIAPIYIKVPESVLMPPRDIKILLEAIEELFEVECLVAFSEIEETGDGPRIIAEDGMVASQLLLITTRMGEDEVITGIITPEGEYELLCFELDNSITLVTVCEEVVEDLGLEYVGAVTDMRREWLETRGEFYDDSVYLPHFLYD